MISLPVLLVLFALAPAADTRTVFNFDEGSYKASYPGKCVRYVGRRRDAGRVRLHRPDRHDTERVAKEDQDREDDQDQAGPGRWPRS
jgi:hypothetical protein